MKFFPLPVLVLSLGLLSLSCQNNTEAALPSQLTTEPQPENNPTKTQPGPEKARDDNPAGFDELLQQVRKDIRRKDFAAASLKLKKARNLDSLNAELLFLQGQNFMAENRSREARNAWTRCAQRYPENKDCRLELGKLYLSLNDFTGALKFLNEIIALDNYHAQALFYKGLVVRNRNKDTALALSYFQKAVELEPNYLEALDMLSTTLVQIGDSLAPFYLRRLAELQPQNHLIYYKLGVYFMNRNEINPAIESYTKATELNPRDADSYYNLGFIFIQLKEYQDARDYFSRALRVSPENNYKAYYGRAYAHEVLGDVINAEKDYRAALKALPMYEPAMAGLRRIQQ